MQKLLREYMDELNKRHKKNRRTGIAVLVLVVIVFGSVMGVLTQYGVAMTGRPQCGMEEHTHTDECYEKTLICGLEENEGHTHTEECLYPAELTCGQEESESHTHTDECYTVPEGYACGQEESEGHTHTDECYEETLICGKEEHIHTDACYMDAEEEEKASNAEEEEKVSNAEEAVAEAEADAEDPAAWDSQYAATEWKNVWGEDLATAARLQIGYQESTENYTAAADGSQKGYTRYGHFAGDMYADWDAAFVNFCLHYAGIKESGFFPEETDTAKWCEAYEAIRAENAAYLTAPENYMPKTGDIVFFQKENEETTDQMGIVSAVNEANRTITVIEGNNANEVKETEYSLDDGENHIVRYLKVTELQAEYQNLQNAAEGAVEPAAEENWAYEESVETENVVIHVKAKENVVPEGAVLSVTPIEKTEITEDMPAEEAAKAEEINEQYELTNQKLQEESEKKEEVLQGFLAYDISFLVDGQETEPNGEVNVTMEFKEAVKPEGVSEDAVVAVSHLKEDETAEDGIVVEDLTEKDAATVVTTEENASVEKVELVTESFSTFTIQWVYLEWIFGQVSIEFVDENEKQINVNDTSYQFDYGKKVNLEDVVKQITDVDGKRYSIQRFEAIDNTSWSENKYDIIAIERNDNGFIFYKNNQESKVYSINDIDRVVVKAICSEIAGIRIKDNIVESGTINVEGGEDFENDAISNGKMARYIWHKKIGDSEEQEVTFIKYEDEMSNISEDGKTLYVALDKGALNDEQTKVEYWVELQILNQDGEVDQQIVSEPFSIKYYDQVQNGSFEYPVITKAGSWMEQLAITDDLGWKSTSKLQESAADVGIEIIRVVNGEITGTGFGYGESGFGAAAEGSQFAELNCESDGALYQDILTIPGRPLNYYFSHRGRANSASNGNDTMKVVILPTRIAEKEGYDGGPIDTQEEVLALIDKCKQDPDKYPGVYVKDCTARAGVWQEHSDVYIPEDSLVRFFFVSTQTGTRTQGNFLDNVWFGQEVPVPSSGKFALGIKKTVQGLDVNDLSELKDKLGSLEFEIAVKDSTGQNVSISLDSTDKLVPGKSVTLTAGEMYWTYNPEDGSYTGTKTYMDNDIGVKEKYTISVTEKSHNIDGYQVRAESEASVTDGKDVVNTGTGNQSIESVEVQAKQKAEITFTNTYTKEEPPLTVDWKMIKCSTSTDSAGNKLFLSEAEFTASDSEGKVVAKGTSGTGGEITWKAVDADKKETAVAWKPQSGTYTITETKAPAGYSLMSSLQVTFTNGTPAFENNEYVEKKDNAEGDTTVTFYLKNTPLYSLPSTGGSGIYWYMFSGVLLIAGATLFLYKNKVQGGAGKLD